MKNLNGHLLNAAKSTYTPKVKDWLDKVQYIYKLEEISAMKRENSAKFNQMWQPWWLFTQSDEFATANI